MNKYLYYYFLLLILSSLINILLVPQFELPDGTHHLVKVILIEQNKIYFNSIFTYFKEIYFLIYQPFHQISLSLPINDICENMRLNNLSNCGYGTDYNIDFKNNANKFSKFGLDLNIYEYYTNFISKHQISLILFNSFFYFLIFVFFKNQLLEKEYIKVVFIFLLFPSVITITSYVSPNFLSTILNIFIFYFFLIRKYYLIFFLTLISLLIDYQNVTHLFTIIMFLFLYKFNQSFKLNLLFIFIFFIFLFLIIFQMKPFVYLIISNLTNYSSSDLSYLNENLNFLNLFKSITSFYLSLYYIGGSMQYLASIIEYFIFIILFGYYFFYNLIRIGLNKIDFYSNKNTIFIYFIISNLSFLFISHLFPTISQGRYYLVTLLPVIYFYVNNFISNKNYLFEFIILILFVLNLSHALKIFFNI